MHDDRLALRVEDPAGTFRALCADRVAAMFRLLNEIVFPGRHMDKKTSTCILLFRPQLFEGWIKVFSTES
jgi:hypothetical protein